MVIISISNSKPTNMWTKKRYYKIGDEQVAKIQQYYLTTGDTLVNIAAHFGIHKEQVRRITNDALLKKAEEIKFAQL